jgi:hypothetical protein
MRVSRVHIRSHRGTIRDANHRRKGADVKTVKLITLTAVMLGILVIPAVASASGNPYWITGTTTNKLATGSSKSITALRGKGSQKLVTIAATILCGKVTVGSGAKIIGGEPGTDSGSLIYSECIVEGAPTCKPNSFKPVATEGTIETEPLSTTLLTRKGKKPTENNAVLDGFKPTGATNFANIEFKSACSATLKKVKLEVSVTSGDKYGVIAELGKFATAGGTCEEEKVEVVKIGCVKAPATAITEAEEGATVVKAGLTAAGGSASYVGEAEVEVESGVLFGVE